MALPLPCGSGSGDITVDSEAPLNFETNQSLTFTVEVEDLGALTDSAVITVNVNDVNEAPTISGGPFAITENVDNTTYVGTVITSDVDANDTFTYTITATDPATAFAIGENSGDITVSDKNLLNFETTPTFTLTVEVQDSGLLTESADILINLLDDNDAPVLSPNGPFDLPENSPDTTPVGTQMSATDEDLMAGDVLTYTITGGNTGDAFDIGSSNGQITVLNGSLLDFDAPPTSYDLIVQVEDSAGAMDTETVTINLTNVNEPPVTSNSTFTPNENAGNTTHIGFVDADDPEDDGLNFVIDSGNTGSAFDLNATTGEITVNDINQLDFETTPAFTLTVNVNDTVSPR